MPFAKLDSALTRSSLWSEECYVRVVFLSFLSLKDESGVVDGTRSSLQRLCNVSMKEFDASIKVLTSPDPESKSKEFEGRRIEKIDDGYLVLNHGKYRLPEQEKKENRREYMKEYMRNKRKNDNSVNNININKVNSELTPVNDELTSVSVSESVSNSLSVSSDISNKGKSSLIPRVKIKINPEHRECSDLLKKRILETRQAKIEDKKLLSWDDEVRKMIKYDNRSIEDIKSLINECHDMEPQKGGFTWRNNILSMKKLRYHWNEGNIAIGMNQKIKPKEKLPVYKKREMVI